MDWSLVALAVVAVASQALIAAAWIVIGGVGGQWLVHRALTKLSDDVLHIDDRITREVKQRAGREGVEARQDAKSLKDQANEALAAAGVPERVSRKPSTIASINAGKR